MRPTKVQLNKSSLNTKDLNIRNKCSTLFIFYHKRKQSATGKVKNDRKY